MLVARRFLARLAFLPRRTFLSSSYAPILPFSHSQPSQSPFTLRVRPSITRHFSSSRPSLSTPNQPIPQNQPLSQRLKQLIKSYGWYALGVYLTISVVDFGVAFAGINLLGAEHVSRVVAVAKEAVAGFIHTQVPEPGREETESIKQSHGGSEGFYAMLVLAYTVHKTLFMPVRIGLTAAFTPKLVNWLSRRGWAGGAGTRRAATEIKERMRDHTRN